jgi:IrrE N-terminal-like domain
LPEAAEASGDPGATTDRLTAAIASHVIAVDYVQELDGALGTSSGGRIQVLAGLQPAAEFMVLAHEFAHELLHHGDDRPNSRDTRELEAEAVAFVVGGAVGLNTSDASRDYILLYRGDREALSGSLDRIQRAASVILKAISVAQR